MPLRHRRLRMVAPLHLVVLTPCTPVDHTLCHASWKGQIMSDTWQTIEQAAVTLGLSVRTVNRHITAGKLESRLFEGRREVRVMLADPAPAPRATAHGNGQSLSDSTGTAPSLNAGDGYR